MPRTPTSECFPPIRPRSVTQSSWPGDANSESARGLSGTRRGFGHVIVHRFEAGDSEWVRGCGE